MPKPLPPPLPPAERTVGQLVAEAIRLYGQRFWRALALGVGPAVLTAALRFIDGWSEAVALMTVGGVVLSISFVGAVAIADERPVRWAAAVAVGVLVFLPFPLLVRGFVLPGLAWLAAF